MNDDHLWRSGEPLETLAAEVQDFLRQQMPRWEADFEGVETMSVAVMGCVVNGPGESKHADIGISLPGTGERPAAPVYVDGEKATTLRGDHITRDFMRMVDAYVRSHYGKGSAIADP